MKRFKGCTGIFHYSLQFTVTMTAWDQRHAALPRLVCCNESFSAIVNAYILQSELRLQQLLEYNYNNHYTMCNNVSTTGTVALPNTTVA